MASAVYTALSFVGRKSVHPSRLRALAATVGGQAGADLPAERQDDDRMQLELRVMLLFCGVLFRQFSGLAAGTSLSGVRVECSHRHGEIWHTTCHSPLRRSERASTVTDWRPDSSPATPPTSDGSGLGSDHLPVCPPGSTSSHGRECVRHSGHISVNWAPRGLGAGGPSCGSPGRSS